jgi:hypothetical protein
MDKADEKQLKATIHRCPFCHEGAEAEGSVVCQGCLARHHEPCWNEAGGRCGSCGAERALSPTALPPLTVDQAGKVLRERGYAAREVAGFLQTLQGAARPAERRRGGGWALVLALLVLVGGALAGLSIVNQSSARQRELERERVKLQSLVDEEARLVDRLSAARIRLVELTADMEGRTPDELRNRGFDVSFKVAKAELAELEQRYGQVQLDRQYQELRLGE